MKQTNYELYRKYFSTTTGRFYTEEESYKLLNLFARGEGIKEGTEAFDRVHKTVLMVEDERIDNLTSSKNYALLTSMLGLDEEQITAADALNSCFEAIKRENKPLFTDSVEWRVSVFGRAPQTMESKLETAYINYSAGRTAEAIEGFSKLVEIGSIDALEHLSVIHYDRGELEQAYFYSSLLKKILTEELELELSPWFEKDREECCKYISEDKIKEIDEKVKREKSFMKRNGISPKNVISGFTR
ncbi:MAG: hypothetical protein IJ309_03630 [Clostridia bacterium]|nr:hypothetical protein [Clostridia bacterium]